MLSAYITVGCMLWPASMLHHVAVQWSQSFILSFMFFKLHLWPFYNTLFSASPPSSLPLPILLWLYSTYQYLINMTLSHKLVERTWPLCHLNGAIYLYENVTKYHKVLCLMAVGDFAQCMIGCAVDKRTCLFFYWQNGPHWAITHMAIKQSGCAVFK